MNGASQIRFASLSCGDQSSARAPSMKNPIALACACAAFAFSACIPSVKPFFEAKDVILEPRLLGEWKADDDSMLWTFTQNGEHEYKLAVLEKHKDKPDQHGELRVHAFKLEGHTFLDLFANEVKFEPGQTDLVNWSVFRGHMLAQVIEFEPALKVSFFNWEWLDDFLEKNPKALAHHREEENVVLIADTRDLQRFILAHLRDDELFSEPGTLLRVAPSADPTTATKDKMGSPAKEN